MVASPLDYAWRTDRGCVRDHNEDAVVVDRDMRLVIVADGIGGATSGEVASRLATIGVGEYLRSRRPPLLDRQAAARLVRDAVEDANRVIWEWAKRSARYRGMGTTVVLGLAGLGWLVVAHVGDSRLYRLRAGRLDQLTRDHSLIQEVVDNGFFPSIEDAEHYGINAHIITRGLGGSKGVEVDVQELDLRPGDLYLFCTDGLSGMVSDAVIAQVLAEPDADLGHLVDTLVDLARAGGGLDNITVALMRVP